MSSLSTSLLNLNRPAAANAPTAANELKFSAHARKRLGERSFDSRLVEQLSKATDKAAAKGSRDSLVLMDDLGLIVNVPSRTVVTAVDSNRMSEGVFTNIDSTVIIRN